MAKRGIDIKIKRDLTENIFRRFFPDIYDEESRILRGERKRRDSISVEEIFSPNIILESEKELEMGWPEGSFFMVEDLTTFFKADIIDIQNGKEENKISTPKFISFAKCKRKKF